VRRAAAVALILCGCLGPRVSDEPGGGDGILPAGSSVPSADDDAALDARLAAHDGVAGVVTRLSAFAGGAPAHVWSFGPAPAFAMPVFVLVRETAPDTYVLVDHPPIADAVPGAATYSPFASLFYVEVTDAYQGQLLTSTYAVQEAVTDGLVNAPFVAMHGVHWPIVASDARLDVGGAAPLAPATRMFYDGEQVRYFDFGDLALTDAATPAVLPRYVLHRDGEEPLSEPIRHVDMDGDGDTNDSNDVHALTPADAGYSPSRRTIDVAVPIGTASIDTSQDERVAAITNATQLFDPGPVTGTVIAFDTTTEILDLPQQRTAGGL
jgi:hypothetical protein